MALRPSSYSFKLQEREEDLLKRANENPRLVLGAAVYNGSLNICKLLFTLQGVRDVINNPILNCEHESIEIESIMFGGNIREPETEFCINYCANVNCESNISVWTPLFLAAKCGLEEICLLLIKLGADVNSPSNGKLSPLSSAIMHKHYQVCRLLASHGSYISPIDMKIAQKSDIPLYYFLQSKRENIDKVRILILLERKYNEKSVFSEDAFPLDLIEIIFKLSGLISSVPKKYRENIIKKFKIEE